MTLAAVPSSPAELETVKASILHFTFYFYFIFIFFPLGIIHSKWYIQRRPGKSLDINIWEEAGFHSIQDDVYPQLIRVNRQSTGQNKMKKQAWLKGRILSGVYQIVIDKLSDMHLNDKSQACEERLSGPLKG